MEFVIKVVLVKFLKFGAVGFSGVIVDFGITYLCKEKLRIQKFVSNAIGFCIAATSNYILNRIWTFESQNPNIFIEFLKFFGVSLLGLGINTLVLYFFHTKFKWNFWLAKLAAIAIVTLWNFAINTLFTFTI